MRTTNNLRIYKQEVASNECKNNNPILNKISFEIKAGEKVAFIGRTGAGKSSIIVALFRLIECNEGGKISIDEINIQELSLNRLRCALAIIPQQLFFFQGTLKQNLDPFNTQNEKIFGELYQMLEWICLLKTQVSDLNLSAGQKQLFCLARAILFRKKIIILDEASADIDLITDEHIQEIISQKFIDCTIIAIAHRINTISHYDKIFILDKGNIIEEGTPFDLLCDDLNCNEINKNPKFSEIIKEGGKQNAEKIFEIAKGTYQINKDLEVFYLEILDF